MCLSIDLSICVTNDVCDAGDVLGGWRVHLVRGADAAPHREGGAAAQGPGTRPRRGEYLPPHASNFVPCIDTSSFHSLHSASSQTRNTSALLIRATLLSSSFTLSDRTSVTSSFFAIY